MQLPKADALNKLYGTMRLGEEKLPCSLQNTVAVSVSTGYQILSADFHQPCCQAGTKILI